ncbi:lysophospholipase-like protein [Rhexocercosporidium sp. MPI-PUGE-AT-0058]|nr:lysophospholipase-like protein [Rhexocercosporidium sp. MPI-PUGE-AT-0058]
MMVPLYFLPLGWLLCNKFDNYYINKTTTTSKLHLITYPSYLFSLKIPIPALTPSSKLPHSTSPARCNTTKTPHITYFQVIMSLQTYETQAQWKELQALLPSSLYFDEQHKPVEEFWEYEGHQLHLDRWRNPQAKIRVIMHHGVGTNGRQLSMILGRPLIEAGFEAVAIDMPNYGMTRTAPGARISYDDWVTISNAFLTYEQESDSRPIVLYGLSAGGLLTYHVAALNKKVLGIIGMTFIDMRHQATCDSTCLNTFMSRVGVPMASLATKLGLGSLSIPMSLASKMWALCNNPAAMKIFKTDKTSAAAWTTMKFLDSYTSFKPEMEPEEFNVCPILLTQPMQDTWTPLQVAKQFLDRVTQVEVTIVELEGTGHYPIEQKGLEHMTEAIVKFLRGIEGKL